MQLLPNALSTAMGHLAVARLRRARHAPSPSSWSCLIPITWMIARAPLQASRAPACAKCQVAVATLVAALLVAAAMVAVLLVAAPEAPPVPA
jgi:hypothetical protein